MTEHPLGRKREAARSPAGAREPSGPDPGGRPKTKKQKTAKTFGRRHADAMCEIALRSGKDAAVDAFERFEEARAVATQAKSKGTKDTKWGSDWTHHVRRVETATQLQNALKKVPRDVVYVRWNRYDEPPGEFFDAFPFPRLEIAPGTTGEQRDAARRKYDAELERCKRARAEHEKTFVPFEIGYVQYVDVPLDDPRGWMHNMAPSVMLAVYDDGRVMIREDPTLEDDAPKHWSEVVTNMERWLRRKIQEGEMPADVVARHEGTLDQMRRHVAEIDAAAVVEDVDEFDADAWWDAELRRLSP